jgi:GTP-sensing pleiotropic transcriptional regulator CodY
MEQVIIVADEKSKLYTEVGTNLKNILGASKKCETVLWGLKQYNDNKATITSSQKIIFIGENDASRHNISSIEWKYKKLNMRYGWIGSVAMIQVLDNSLSKDELDIFKKMCNEQKNEVQKLAKSNIAGNVAVGIAAAIVTGAIGLAVFAVIKIVTSATKAKSELLKKEYNYLITEFLVKDLVSFIGIMENEE